MEKRMNDPRNIQLGLSRMNEIMSLLGNPQEAFPYIHIAGTNGKGSVGAYLSHLLSKTGETVGWFSSPAIFSEGEEIAFVTQGKIQYLTEEERSCYQQELNGYARNMSEPLTPFEGLTALAFYAFAKKKVDRAVIECGMGGRGDSTNVVKNPQAVVFTSIDVDHVNFLGHTLEEISKEKAGIIKENTKVIIGDEKPEVRRVIEKEAEEKHGKIYRVEGEIPYEVEDECVVFDFLDIKRIRLKTLGAYQVQNACLAITCARALGITDPTLIQKSLEETRISGRMEVIRKKPLWIRDGGHNPAGITALLQSLPPGAFGCVFGVFADKEYEKMLDLLCERISVFILVRPTDPRGLDPEIAKSYLEKKGIRAFVSQSVKDGLKLGDQMEMNFVICGSLSLLKEAGEWKQ